MVPSTSIAAYRCGRGRFRIRTASSCVRMDAVLRGSEAVTFPFRHPARRPETLPPVILSEAVTLPFRHPRSGAERSEGTTRPTRHPERRPEGPESKDLRSRIRVDSSRDHSQLLVQIFRLRASRSAQDDARGECPSALRSDDARGGQLGALRTRRWGRRLEVPYSGEGAADEQGHRRSIRAQKAKTAYPISRA